MSRYARAVADPEAELGPTHQALVDYVPDSTDVLDVGCSAGYLAARLTQRGCRVVGIDLDHADAQAARQFCSEVVEGDLDELDLPTVLNRRRFDVVLCGDVLEHLKRPDRALAGIRACLKDDGRLVVSIPNVAHASVRLQLLLGDFWYTPVGLLDETHLRFFTLESFTAMAQRADFVVRGMTRIEEPINPRLWSEVLERLDLPPSAGTRLRDLLSEPSATTFQYVMDLRPCQPGQQPPPPVEQPAWTHTLTDYMAERDVLLAQLHQQVEEQTQWALASAEQVRERDEIIRQLQKQLQEQTDWALASAEKVRERDDIINRLQDAGSHPRDA